MIRVCPWGRGSRSKGSRASAGRLPPGRSAEGPRSRKVLDSLEEHKRKRYTHDITHTCKLIQKL